MEKQQSFCILHPSILCFVSHISTFLYTRLFHFLIRWEHVPNHMQYLYSLCGEAGFRLQSTLGERSAQQAVPVPYRLLSPILYFQQEGKDSNSDQWFWRPTCYRYTTNLYIVILLTFITSIRSVGFEPTLTDFTSIALPIETYDCSITSEEFTKTLRTF